MLMSFFTQLSVDCLSVKQPYKQYTMRQAVSHEAIHIWLFAAMRDWYMTAV